MTSLTQRINAANKAGRKAIIPFLTAGFPTKNDFFTHLEELDANGADIIEIGVPFSDPAADGPVVEAASLKALEQGVTLQWIIEELTKRKGQYQAELVLMGYINPFYQYGFEKFAQDAANAGVSGLIVPDLPLDEDDDFKTILKQHGITLISLIGLNTPKERMQAYAEKAEGYVYVVSYMGTTGAAVAFPPELKKTLSEAREAFNIPLALGFGIKEPKQLEPFGDAIDAVVFGSALIKDIEKKGSAIPFMERWK
ncbi:tryptophan synthase subunit alpha [Halodesulfovibrio sp.]|jgi:tryptophan synthase alpha chain|uniref:tryptophan synthase subunit alpha n=1 Tax=Halodesulfovibrio sp. TaxID=1912772 RepID=UPI0025CDADCA|nr:tryptophan synthase subunit alpha [Halodesulfovibrio sp.]MCT4626661.1 tryptophan synthase subunit alpha [Halodesulfovibrio sp.]